MVVVSCRELCGSTHRGSGEWAEALAVAAEYINRDYKADDPVSDEHP